MVEASECIGCTSKKIAMRILGQNEVLGLLLKWQAHWWQTRKVETKILTRLRSCRYPVITTDLTMLGFCIEPSSVIRI
jgi:hypothetical protein